MEDNKVSKKKYGMFLEKLEGKLESIDKTLTNYSNKFITVENYCEKYIPIKIQNMILDNIKIFVSKEVLQKLKSQENKVYTEITE